MWLYFSFICIITKNWFILFPSGTHVKFLKSHIKELISYLSYSLSIVGQWQKRRIIDIHAHTKKILLSYLFWCCPFYRTPCTVERSDIFSNPVNLAIYELLTFLYEACARTNLQCIKEKKTITVLFLVLQWDLYVNYVSYIFCFYHFPLHIGTQNLKKFCNIYKNHLHDIFIKASKMFLSPRYIKRTLR